MVKQKNKKEIYKVKKIVAKKTIRAKKAKKVSPIKKIIKVEKNIKEPKNKITKGITLKNIIKKGKIAKTAPKKVIVKKVKKSPKIDSIQGFPAESLFKAKIKVIGVGGGGGSIVSEIGRSLEKATFVIADTDMRALKKKSGIKSFLFGQELTHGLGTGVDVDLAKQAAESAKEKISGLFKDQDIIIFVASLGGGLGSGATQIFAEAAKEFGGITFGIFTMPFKFEGQNKYRIAQNALKCLKQSLNVSLVIPNEKIFKVIDASTPITNAFSTVNKSLMESLESLIDLIYNPGVINIDFADLRTVLRGRGNNAFLNTVEASGKDRVEKICENIFKNPLLQNNGFAAEKILFNIAGSENLSMFEVERISSHIAQVNQKTKIIFGISKDQKLNNKIKTTILMTGGNYEEKEEILSKVQVKKPEQVKVATVKKEVEKKIEKKSEDNKIIKAEKIVEKKKEPEIKKIIDEKPRIKEAKPIKVTKPKPVVKRPVVENKPQVKKEEKIKVSVPEIKIPVSLPVAVVEPKIDIKAIAEESSQKGIRRSALEIKKAEELEEKRKTDQEKEWEIPAFLRKIKYKG